MKLSTLIASATGPSKELDLAISKSLKVPLRSYSSSVDACLELIHEKLPAAHWHIGRSTDGVSMYATLNNGRHRIERTNITVPLVLLAVVIASLDHSS